jgi:hypothetical protein
VAASKNLELARLQFEDDGACDPRFFARSSPKLFCQASDRGLGFCQPHIVFEGVLDGYRLRRSVWDDCTVVNSPSEFVKVQEAVMKRATDLTPEYRNRAPQKSVSNRKVSKVS